MPTYASPSLDPRNFDDLGFAYVREAVEVANAAYERYGTTVVTISGDLRIADLVREEKIAQARETESQKGIRALTAAQTKLQEAVARIHQKVDNKLSPPDPPKAAEIRSALRSLSSDDYRAEVARAKKEGDFELLGAIVGERPFLSGSTEAEVTLIRHEILAGHMPEEKKNLERLNKMGARLSGATAAFKKAMGMTDPPASKDGGPGPAPRGA